jgi:rhamnogalacturonyl hydrolase YesR
MSIAYTPRGSDLDTALRDSLDRVILWVRRSNYRAYEPADGNLSFLHRLTGDRVLPMRILQQAVLRSPVNIRPLLGIRRHSSAIGRGYMAWGCAIASSLGDGHGLLEQEAIASLDWLIANRAPRYHEFCWGDPYDYATRSGRRPYLEPLLVWSALIGQAFLEGYERFGQERFLSVATSVRNWILALPVERTADGLCLSYVSYRQSSIHNANLMGAAFLARIGATTGDLDALTVARAAAAYTCARQLSDGAWYYAEEPKFHWIDSFHTGYNLWALRKYREYTVDASFDLHLTRGAEYYKSQFFEADGRPRYFHDQAYPVDIQCASQAIETLATLSDDDPECLELARRIAEWTIGHMQDADGHFYYRDLGWTKVRTAMFHWGQGTMVKALAVLLANLKSTRESPSARPMPLTAAEAQR